VTSSPGKLIENKTKKLNANERSNNAGKRMIIVIESVVGNNDPMSF